MPEQRRGGYQHRQKQWATSEEFTEWRRRLREVAGRDDPVIPVSDPAILETEGQGRLEL